MATKMASAWVEAEFEIIFRQHYERLVSIARRVLRCDAEAEEICAEVFVKLYRIGPGVLSKGPAGAWLYRVATRASIDRLRQNKRRGLEEEPDPNQLEPADGPLDDPLNRIMREEAIAEVRLALTRMKTEKAQLLLLRHSGLSYQEIAAAMEIKPTSVGTMLARAEAEFSELYQRQQRLGKRSPHLETAKEGR